MKVRSVLKGVGIALCVIFLLGFITTLFDWGKVKPKKYDYEITYLRADTGENIRKEYSFMFLVDGNYPQGYSNGTETFEISDLAGAKKETECGTMIADVIDPKDLSKSYRFAGWYLDKACTQEFEGVVKHGSVGDLTLYAKILESGWSTFY